MGCVTSTSEETKVSTAEAPDLYQWVTQPCPKFTWKNFWGLAYVTKVVDGDTIHANWHSPIGTYNFTFRLAHINAPETRKETRPLHLAHGHACSVLLTSLIEHRFVYLLAHGLDRCKRILVDVYAFYQDTSSFQTSSPRGVDRPPRVLGYSQVLEVSPHWLHVNQWFLKHTSCVPYEGRGKSVYIFRNWTEYHPWYQASHRPVTT